jgi:predicted kinase
MSQQMIVMCKGLPASGKSTWSKKLVLDEPGQWKRINKDDLRAMLDAGKWSKKNEDFILSVRDTLIGDTLAGGYSVIVDDTNLLPKHHQRLEHLSKVFDVGFRVQDFTHVPLDECIKRDKARENSVGEKVIRNMYDQYLKPRIPVPTYDPGLPDCYIFDIDGTLAIMGNRSPYDWAKVGLDTVNQPVVKILEMIISSDPRIVKLARIIILSGRDSVCREETIEWLEDNGIDEWDGFWMRPEGDTRKDSIIKQELYEQHIKGKYNVLGIFDDRNQVVEMWRSLGLPCFQVAEGDF